MFGYKAESSFVSDTFPSRPALGVICHNCHVSNLANHMLVDCECLFCCSSHRCPRPVPPSVASTASLASTPTPLASMGSSLSTWRRIATMLRSATAIVSLKTTTHIAVSTRDILNLMRQNRVAVACRRSSELRQEVRGIVQGTPSYVLQCVFVFRSRRFHQYLFGLSREIFLFMFRGRHDRSAPTRSVINRPCRKQRLLYSQTAEKKSRGTH